MQEDRSNGYERVAAQFIAAREPGRIGAAAMRAWTRFLPRGATVLDIGCGSGVPVSEVLIEEGFEVFGVDASPSLVAAFRAHFPESVVQCQAVEESDLFGRTFDAAIAVGLLFLLQEDVQRRLIPRVAGALRRGGRFLFSAPAQRITWRDMLTGHESRSLGAVEYRALLSMAGFRVVGEYADEGDNHYYDSVRA